MMSSSPVLEASRIANSSTLQPLLSQPGPSILSRYLLLISLEFSQKFLNVWGERSIYQAWRSLIWIRWPAVDAQV